MKTTKLVLGIINLILPLMILLQSCAAGLYNSMEANQEVSGTFGVLVALLILAGGIVMVATRSSTTAGGSWAGVILFLIAAFAGFTFAGSFTDLNVWAGWCIIMAIINLIAALKIKKNKNA